MRIPRGPRRGWLSRTVSLLVEDHPCTRCRPIGAAALRTEAVEDYLLALGSELEYDAASRGAGAVFLVEAVGPCRPIQVASLVKDRVGGEGILSIGAVALCAEIVAETTVARSKVASAEFFRSIHTNSALLHGRFHRLGSISHPLFLADDDLFCCGKLPWSQ
jgi:hypothetical protein